MDSLHNISGSKTNPRASQLLLRILFSFFHNTEKNQKIKIIKFHVLIIRFWERTTLFSLIWWPVIFIFLLIVYFTSQWCWVTSNFWGSLNQVAFSDVLIIIIFWKGFYEKFFFLDEFGTLDSFEPLYSLIDIVGTFLEFCA